MKLLSDFDNGKGDQWGDKIFKADQIIHNEVSKAINKAQLHGRQMVLRVARSDENKINIIESRLRGVSNAVVEVSETKKEVFYTFSVEWEENLDDDIEFLMGDNNEDN